jgi:hypothetical protein
MKSLTEYLNEQMLETPALEINEANEKWYRFTNSQYDDQTVIDNMKAKAESAGFYVENVDGGVKVRVDEDKVNNLSTLVAWLKQFVNGLKDNETKKSLVEKLEKVIADMEKDMEDANKKAEDAAAKAKEEEEKQKEEEKKATEEAEKKAKEAADKAAEAAKSK